MRSALVRVWDRICDTAYDRPFLAAGIVLALGGLLAWRLLFVDGPPQLPDETWKLDEACEDPGRAYADAARYGGSPPHPIAVFAELGYEHHDSMPWLPDDPADVQLVACLEHLGPDPSPDVTPPAGGGFPLECEYSALGMAPPGTGRMVPLVAAEYRLTLYELRTGREVTTEQLVGDHYDCPGAIADDEREVSSTVSLDQLDYLLTPYLQGRR